MKMNDLQRNGTETSGAIPERRARMDGYTIVRAILRGIGAISFRSVAYIVSLGAPRDRRSAKKCCFYLCEIPSFPDLVMVDWTNHENESTST
jgi:hypothetical protein